MVGQAPAGTPSRLHWSSMLGALVRQVKSMWAIFAGGTYALVVGGGHWILWIAAASVILSLVGILLGWWRFTFRIAKDQILIDSGILRRNHRSIPFDRVHDVDISQGPVARLLGVARVSFETGGSKAGDDDGVLAAIRLADAEGLRRTIRTGYQAPASDAPLQAEPASAADDPLFILGTRRLLLAGLFNFSFALFAGLFGAAQSLRAVPEADPFDPAFWAAAERYLGPLSNLFAMHRILAAVAAAFLILVVGMSAGVVTTVLRDHGFRLDRTTTGLRRRRGLLTRTDVTLPLRRVQSLLIDSGPVRSALGMCEVSLQSLARDELRGAHVVAPLARPHEVERIAGKLGWTALSAKADWQPISRSYLWMGLFAASPLILFLASPLLLLAAIAVMKPGGLASSSAETAAATAIPLLLLALVGVRLLLRWLGWKHTGYMLDGEWLRIRKGWWRRRIYVLPVGSVQSVDLSQTLIDRRFGTMSLTLGIAGSGGYGLPAIPREKARQLRAQLLSLTS